MRRKILLTLILILLIFCCYQMLLGKHEGIRSKIPSMSMLRASNAELTSDLEKLQNASGKEFETKKQILEGVIEDYQSAKEEYEEMMPSSSPDAILEAEENDLKDVYDVDFLWTILGNYASEEGINLKFDIKKNTTSASAMNNQSSDYIVCDLLFTLTGNYINLTDFIYDIEDDDRLNFEVKDFEMKTEKVTEKVNGAEEEKTVLVATLKVQAVKINSDNLIEPVEKPDTEAEDSSDTADDKKKEETDSADDIQNIGAGLMN